MKKKEVSLVELIGIINNRKKIIFIIVILSLLAALALNFFIPPVYQSSVLVKKDMNLENRYETDKIENILAIRNTDPLETEMELVTTRSVVDKVIEEKSLNIKIKNLIKKNGTVIQLNLPLLEYQNRYLSGKYPADYPKINKINIGYKTKGETFTIKNNVTEVYDKKNRNVFKTNLEYSEKSKADWVIDIEFNMNNINAIEFTTLNYNKLIGSLTNNISTDKKIKTNIFSITAKSEYPYIAATIANSLAKNLKEVRKSQLKDNIKTNYLFIDERLNEVYKKLHNAESELSNYKAKENLAEITEQSRTLIAFLSTLESDKLKNDLELDELNNKISKINNQMENNKFVDQTYLTREQFDAPFTKLLNQLNDLEIKKLELTQKRTKKHPEVIRLNEKIEEIKNKLKSFNFNTISALKIIKASNEKKEKRLNNLIRKYSNKLLKLPKQEAKLASLIRKKDAFEKMYTLLLDKREEMRLAELSKIQDLIVLDAAVEAIKPVTPNKYLNLALAGIFGLLAGLVGVILVHFTDKKVNDINDIEREFDYSILSVIPKYDKNIKKSISNSGRANQRFVTMMDEQFRFKEAYRTLETKLTSRVKSTPKKVMITSCEENAGKTTVSSNLALTIAQSGKKVLLIDCDIKNPSVAKEFNISNKKSGLVDYLTEKVSTPNIYKPIKVTNNSNLLLNLDILPTGEFANISGEILASDRMKDYLDNLDYYDFIILDTPPITRVSDAISLGRIVKDTVLVVRSAQTIKESISWAISELNNSEVKLHGLVVNGCNVKQNSYKYQYGYSSINK